jgi:MarR family transcriptional regulator, organic hydroperoxide resistance regulator
VTSVLDRLEQRGHITRGPRPGDRRAVLIELTGTGRRAAATVRQTLAGLEQRALADLDPGALAGFHAVLHALMEVPS